jgi:transcriptional regulator with XRE-family HTH domain
MKKQTSIKRNPDVSVTLRELRTRHDLTTREMADRLNMPIKEYIRAENGTPPVWMERAITFFQACFELGYLPENVSLPRKPLSVAEKPEKYSA